MKHRVQSLRLFGVSVHCKTRTQRFSVESVKLMMEKDLNGCTSIQKNVDVVDVFKLRSQMQRSLADVIRCVYVRL